MHASIIMRLPPRPRCTMPLRPTAIDAVDESPLHQLTYLGITCSKTMPPRGRVTQEEPPSSDPTPRSRVSPVTSRHEAEESQQRPLQQGNDARGHHHFQLRLCRTPALTGCLPRHQSTRSSLRGRTTVGEGCLHAIRR
jgi:hypothetical protein